MHPSVVFALWLAVVLLIQLLPLGVMAAGLIICLIQFNVTVRQAFLVLLRRSRWILLTLFLTFVLLTPGERVFANYPFSWEGIRMGSEHLIRLLLVLAAVAWLVAGRTTVWLLAALYGMVSGGKEPRHSQFIVRLALTLEYCTKEQNLASWRETLQTKQVGELEPIILEFSAPSPLERFFTYAVLVISLAVLGVMS